LWASQQRVGVFVLAGFSEDDAREVKAIEAVTNHDVKAVEYFLRKRVCGVMSLWWWWW
jgi:adenylosuccinate lyase